MRLPRTSVAMLVWFLFWLTIAPASAQSTKSIPRIGVQYLGTAPCKPSQNHLWFFERLKVLGYIPGNNIEFVALCYSNSEEMRATLRELAARKVNVIFVGNPASAIEAKKSTTEIPIVCSSCGDPLDNGLVKSLARPGGNLTGTASLSAELIGKRLAMLKELVPGLVHVGALINPENPGTRPTIKAFNEYVPKLGLKIQQIEFRKIADFKNAIEQAATSKVGALLIQDDPYTFVGGREIAELVLKHRLIASAGQPEMTDAGVLVAYGPNRKELAEGAAGYVDRILKGENPASLPIQQPTKLDLVINLKTAKALGLVIPQSVLLRADRLVE